MENFQTLAESRYSVRSFSNEFVSQEKLNKILEAGRIAPTAMNKQPQRIKVLSAPEQLEKVDECTPCRYGAPVVLLICYDKNECAKHYMDGHLSGEVDATIVTTHMMLQAQELGIGSCWVLRFDKEKAVKLFKLPENIIPMTMLPIGYPAEDAAPADMHTLSLPLEKILLD